MKEEKDKISKKTLLNIKERKNRKTLINTIDFSLDEHYGLIEPDSNIPEKNEVDSENKNYKPEEESQYNEARDKGEYDISEANPTKIRRKPTEIFGRTLITEMKNRVDIFTKLPSGLTPDEIMNGQKENDFNYFTD
jgi:hypothetical protein